MSSNPETAEGMELVMIARSDYDNMKDEVERLRLVAPDLLHWLEIILGALLLRMPHDERPKDGIYPRDSAIREAQETIELARSVIEECHQ